MCLRACVVCTVNVDLPLIQVLSLPSCRVTPMDGVVMSSVCTIDVASCIHYAYCRQVSFGVQFKKHKEFISLSNGKKGKRNSADNDLVELVPQQRIKAHRATQVRTHVRPFNDKNSLALECCIYVGVVLVAHTSFVKVMACSYGVYWRGVT